MRKFIVILCILFIVVAVVLAFSANYFLKFALLSKNYSDSNRENKIENELNSEVTEESVFNTSGTKVESQNWFDVQNSKELTIESHDGLKLVGYFVPSKVETNKLVVLAHGYTSKAKEMSAFAEYYYSQGFNVFAPDDRGHGKSEGKYIGMGIADAPDYIAWMRLLINQLGEDTEIVLHGVSMGGATVMTLSGNSDLPKNVKAIIEDCGYTSVKEEFKYQLKQMFNLPSFPIINVTSVYSKIRIGYNFNEDSAIKQVKKSTTPIFFIHGDKDDFVPFNMVQKLFDAAECEKELWTVPEAGHATSYYLNKEEYEKRIYNFYSKYLSK
ncbi:alpha/beta hydrolase [Clostridium cellulovorans]|uniref:Alpha/beta hydrolase fold n=1 Tax=Clostridium cellulovorans (strain ATCC 35296 / DSM 3052 / OCM 3 / 743B) TaxID=573061 RepID=D9SMW7_CLOC7|nr:alpha/beta hydrolase [Clostridium cellulovorans]ADL51833.1 alpha/beta hydrolase fold [Clostridium cellulovorans 743B]